MKIIFNEQVALEVFSVLGKAWRKKEGIFRDIVLPQDRYPVIDNPREYANWFFSFAVKWTQNDFENIFQFSVLY